MGTIFDPEREARATRTDFLERRLEINRGYSSADFDKWLLARLGVKQGEDVLDVGCGSGAQTIPFADAVGRSGSVSAIDISEDSVKLLKSRLKPGAPVEAHTADMAELAAVIDGVFSVKQYDLSHSSYALYYSPKRMQVLDIMRQALKPAGRCAVFSPNAPHGMVELASRFTSIPEEVNDCLTFGPRVLEPYFKQHFARYEVHLFNNVVTLPTSDLAIEFYRQTTYYAGAAEPAMRSFVEQVIAREGNFQYEKNGYLIIGYMHGV